VTALDADLPGGPLAAHPLVLKVALQFVGPTRWESGRPAAGPPPRATPGQPDLRAVRPKPRGFHATPSSVFSWT
jgi:hypothetical protein